MSDFNPETIIKRTKGKMIMLYAVVDGEESHMASFFHAEKAQYVLDAIGDSTNVEILDEDAKPKRTAKKSAAKKTPARKKTTKRTVKRGGRR